MENSDITTHIEKEQKHPSCNHCKMIYGSVVFWNGKKIDIIIIFATTNRSWMFFCMKACMLQGTQPVNHSDTVATRI